MGNLMRVRTAGSIHEDMIKSVPPPRNTRGTWSTLEGTLAKQRTRNFSGGTDDSVGCLASMQSMQSMQSMESVPTQQYGSLGKQVSTLSKEKKNSGRQEEFVFNWH